jgi:hypothetical protein
MARLIKHLDVQTLADHCTVAILDEGGALPFPTSAGWLDLADNGITIMTLANEIDVPLTVEVWDAEPPPTPIQWPVTSGGRVRFETGRIGINFLVEGDDTVEFDVAPGTYGVRAHAAGRPDLERSNTPASEPAPSEETERYLVQIWPAPTTERPPAPE